MASIELLRVIHWPSVQTRPRRFVCGYCGATVGADRGWEAYTDKDGRRLEIKLCSYCNRPTYFEFDLQVPGAPFGEPVQHVPNDVETLYNEARRCMAAEATTAAVLACRKILMHVAVEKGAEPNKTYEHYVNYLATRGYAPPEAKEWVDSIRKKGNEANHEIVLMGRPDAEELLTFVSMLLKFIYEFPRRVAKKSAQPS